MLCNSCRHLISRSLAPRLALNSIRAYSTPPSSPLPSAAATSPESTSSSTSTPTQRLHAESTVLAGTPLKGINYFANKPDPVALPDEEYPNWLWNLVLDHKVATTTANGMNIAEMTKKQRKRHMKKMAALAAEQPKIIPLHEQSIDITPANTPLSTEEDALKAAAESLEQRTEIRKSARVARRKAIREANFLRGM